MTPWVLATFGSLVAAVGIAAGTARWFAWLDKRERARQPRLHDEEN